jgi:hypothetical protein
MGMLQACKNTVANAIMVRTHDVCGWKLIGVLLCLLCFVFSLPYELPLN